MSNRIKSAFSLIEIAIVVLVIGLIVAGIAQAGRLVQKSAISAARSTTNSSPVALIDDLVLWLETTSEKSFNPDEAENGLTVSLWTDINPKSQNNATQSTTTARPTYREKSINNLPALEFDGTTDFMNLPDGTIPYGNTPYTFFFVAKANSIATSNNLIFSGTASANNSLTLYTETNGTLTNSWSASDYNFGAGSSLTSYNIIAVTYSNTPTLQRIGYINGVAATANTPAAVRNSTGTNNIIGSRLGTADFLNGRLAEIIVYRRALETDERKDIENYLSRKWKIKVQ